jgi:hypothetical protein
MEFLAVATGECQRDRSGHKPVIANDQGGRQKKLALMRGGCQKSRNELNATAAASI